MAFKQFELSNHLGNILATILDRRALFDTAITSTDTFAIWDAYIVAAQDYYPGGMLPPDRVYSADSTGSGGNRFGFNGMERDDELNGAGNAYDFGARLYDARLGKWFSTDPKEIYFSNKSPYNFVSNCPVLMVDVVGMENTIYLYVGEYFKNGENCVELSKSEQEEIFNKVVEIFELINDKSPNGLGINVEFAMTTSVYNKDDLDKSDIFAVVADMEELVSIRGGNNKANPGITRLDGYPVVDIGHNSLVNPDGSKVPNYVDRIAWYIAHEIVHKASQKAGSERETSHNDDLIHDNSKLNLMISGKEIEHNGLPDGSLATWDKNVPSGSSWFGLSNERIGHLQEVFDSESPRDNATRRTSDRNKRHPAPPKTEVPKRKRKDFRKWEKRN